MDAVGEMMMALKRTWSWDVSLQVVDRERRHRRSHVEYIVRSTSLHGAVRAAVDRARSQGFTVIGELGAVRR